MAWTCPDCERRFGATKQGHMCRPGVTIESFFANARPEAEPIHRIVAAHLEGLDGGDLIIDPLETKVLFKNGPTFAILDSKTKWVALGFTVRRRLDSDRFSRKVTEYQGRFHHVVNLTDPAQVDDELLGWLTEAFYRDDQPEGSDAADAGGDGMVPDDVDIDF